MVGGGFRTHSKTYTTPRRPFESERLDEEMKLIGKYGLRCKREVWRAKLNVAKFRKAARTLLTLDEKDPRRLFEGAAMLRRLKRIGVLDDENATLDAVLSIKTESLLDRRLQTMVLSQGLAKTIHHARVLIRQRHIRVGRQVVDSPSFIVRTDSQKHIDLAVNSPLVRGTTRMGRVKKRNEAMRAARNNNDGGDESGSDY